MTDLLSPSQVADLLSCSGHTVRRYGDRYAPQLSDGASSRPRLYTPEDVALLAEAMRLTEAGHQPEEISERLSTTVLPAENVVKAEVDKVDQPDQPLVVTTLPEEATQALVRLADSVQAMASQQETLTAVLVRLERLEASQIDTRRLAWVLAAGIVLGVVLTLAGAWIVAGFLR